MASLTYVCFIPAKGLVRGLSANSSNIAFEVPLALAMSKAYMQLAGKIPGGKPRKIWQGMCGPLLKTLTLFMANIFDFQTCLILRP